MAWEWTGPLGTAAVGVTGIVVTYLSGRRQVAAARQIAEDQAMAALRTQREERHQKRIENAYQALLEAITKAGRWMEQAEEVLHGDLKPKELTTPPDASTLIEKGPAAAVWSPKVAQLCRSWTTKYEPLARQIFPETRVTIFDGRGGFRPGAPLELRDVPAGRVTRDEFNHDRFRRGRRDVEAIEAAIREQVWRELRGEDDGHLPRRPPP